MAKLHGRVKSAHSVSAIVAVSVAVSLLSGLVFVSTMLSHLLPDSMASHANRMTLSLLRLLPSTIFDTLIQLSFWLFLTGLVVGCSVSLIAALRATREAGSSRQSIALAATGAVLATVLCIGPLGVYAYQRATLRRVEAQLKEDREKLQARLKTANIPATHRARLWRLYASDVYHSDGIVVEIPNEEGEMATYQPTEPEVETRKWYVENVNNMRPPYKLTAWAIGVVAISVGLGLLTPILNKPPLCSS